MKRKEYYDMVDTLKRLNSCIEFSIKDDVRKFTVDSALYALFDIVPRPEIIPRNNYYKTDDRDAFKQKVIKRIQSVVVRDFKHINTLANSRQDLSLLSKALFEKDVRFGVTPLDITDHLKETIVSNRDNYTNGQEVVLEILVYWLQQIKKNKHDEIFDDRVVADPLAKKYIYDRETDPHAYEPLPTRPREFDFDDDADNYAYNERHND